MDNIGNWSIENRMKLNFSKTWEMVVRGKIPCALDDRIFGIERKDSLKLLGVNFNENPCNWDLQIDSILGKANNRLYILRICRHYGYPKDQLCMLFHSLIISLFLYGIEIWGSAYQDKYLSRIDRFCKRAYNFGYTAKKISMSVIVADRDRKLWNCIINNPEHALYDLLPPKRKRVLRKRGHDFILPKVQNDSRKHS